MPLAVFLTDDAARDLDGLYDYLPLRHSPEQPDSILKRIKRAFHRLSEFPDRGMYPEERIGSLARRP